MEKELITTDTSTNTGIQVTVTALWNSDCVIIVIFSREPSLDFVNDINPPNDPFCGKWGQKLDEEGLKENYSILGNFDRLLIWDRSFFFFTNQCSFRFFPHCQWQPSCTQTHLMHHDAVY